jgi:GTP-binding protein
VLGISSATGAGLGELTQAIFTSLPEEEAAAEAGDGEFEAEHRVYRPGVEEGFDVIPEGDGRFRIAGRGIELLVARHDLENEEALDYLEGRLREIGVIAALQRAGFEPGDEVVVGDLEFELDPS